jgi:hypothetical protein
MSAETMTGRPRHRSRRGGGTGGVTRPVPATTARQQSSTRTPASGADTGQPACVEAAVAVWASVVAALENAGLREAGPEYLKLSQLLTDQRAQELLAAGEPAPDWEIVQRLAGAALELLSPLVEAAELLKLDAHRAMGVVRRSSAAGTPNRADEQTLIDRTNARSREGR